MTLVRSVPTTRIAPALAILLGLTMGCGEGSQGAGGAVKVEDLMSEKATAVNPSTGEAVEVEPPKEALPPTKNPGR